MADKLAQFLARRSQTPASLFADGVRDAGAAIRRGDEAAAREILKSLPVSEVMGHVLPQIAPGSIASAPRLSTGLAASAGAAAGRPAFTAAEAIERSSAGERIILVRPETDAGDMEAIRRCAGVLTTTGGMTSHAAVVARGWGKPCVSGAVGVRINARGRGLHFNRSILRHNDFITIDGGAGVIYRGDLPVQAAALSEDLIALLALADRVATMKVLANADAPAEAKIACQFGAQGIGLCRTEHMFFERRRLLAMRKMILADSPRARAAALKRMLPWQKRDFMALLDEMDGAPVTIRLIDPPLHEFLPEQPEAQAELAGALKVPVKQVKARVAALREANPMLGHRGCRLCVTFPEILAMQVKAMTAAVIEQVRKKKRPILRILHPLIIAAEEMKLLRRLTSEAIETARREASFDEPLDIPIGAMIEVPRAAILAREIAAHADFFSVGSNDLTQFTLGCSRDDSMKFFPAYHSGKLLSCDPFESLDTEGVGELIALAVRRGREAKPHLPCSLCGEHGGEAGSIRFAQQAGLDAVSCSPFRVPLARLAAAQAKLLNG